MRQTRSATDPAGEPLEAIRGALAAGLWRQNIL